MTCTPVPNDCPLRSASIIEALAAIQDDAYRLLSNRERDGDTCARGRERLAQYEACYRCWGTPEAARFKREQTTATAGRPATRRPALTRSPVTRKQLLEVAV